MTPEENDESWLTAYLDDEVSPEERQWIEARLAEDPRWRQLLDELRGVQLALSELPLPRFPGVVASERWLNPDGDDEERIVSPPTERGGERAVEHASPGWWRVGLTLAASLLLVLAVLGWRVSQRRDSTIASRPAAAARAPSAPQVSAEAAVEAAVDKPGPASRALPIPAEVEGMGGKPSMVGTTQAPVPSSAPTDASLFKTQPPRRLRGNGLGGGMPASDSALVGEEIVGWETAPSIAGRWSSPPPVQGATQFDPVDQRWLQQHFRLDAPTPTGAIVWLWEPSFALDRVAAAAPPLASAPPMAAQAEFAEAEGLAGAAPAAQSMATAKPAEAAQARQAAEAAGSAASPAQSSTEDAFPQAEELRLDSAVAMEVVVPAAEWERLRGVFIRQGLSFEGDETEPSKHRWFRILIPPAR